MQNNGFGYPYVYSNDYSNDCPNNNSGGDHMMHTENVSDNFHFHYKSQKYPLQ